MLVRAQVGVAASSSLIRIVVHLEFFGLWDESQVGSFSLKGSVAL